MDAVVKYPNRWTAGQSGNPHGRPPGARGVFSEEILRTLRKVFAVEGEAAMIRTARESPSAFTAFCAKLLPTEVTALIEQMQPHTLSDGDYQVLKAIQMSIPNAGEREPGEVLHGDQRRDSRGR